MKYESKSRNFIFSYNYNGFTIVNEKLLIVVHQVKMFESQIELMQVQY